MGLIDHDYIFTYYFNLTSLFSNVISLLLIVYIIVKTSYFDNQFIYLSIVQENFYKYFILNTKLSATVTKEETNDSFRENNARLATLDTN
jgi:hypothetical protein